MSSSPVPEPQPSPAGTRARTPAQIPPRGWWQVLRRAWGEASRDQVPLLGAGVAFFGFLSLFPAMIAIVLIYGLVADPATISEQVASLTAALPPEARAVIEGQLQELAASPTQGLGWGVALSILVALWSASGGVGNLVTAVNVAYDEEKKRGFIKEKAVALALTFGAIILVLLVVALVAGVPVVFAWLGIDGGWRWLAEVVRWILVAVLVMLGLAVLYRFAPHRRAPKFRWVSPGAVVATVLWLIACVGLSLYVTLFGNYGRTYGALAGVVVLMLWLWMTSYAVLLGAEINAESEEQTIQDTTVGPERPLGTRGAVKADSVPPLSAEQ